MRSEPILRTTLRILRFVSPLMYTAARSLMYRSLKYKSSYVEISFGDRGSSDFAEVILS